jgi:hypothetical protein
MWRLAVEYKTIYVPLGGRGPAKYAQLLEKELSQLDSQGYQVIAITPIAQEHGATQGLLVTGRRAER